MLDAAIAGEIESDAGALRSTGSAAVVTRHRRLDVYVFWSFDLVGSTALKAKRFDRLHWVDVIRDFYTRCEEILRKLHVDGAQVWKYIGDEVLFYRKITEKRQIEDTVKAVFRALDAYMTDLAAHPTYAEVADAISIKAFAWMVPVKSYDDGTDGEDRFAGLIDKLSGDDQAIEEGAGLDFLGPNIDAGFRVGAFARKKQLVLSAALANYLIDTKTSANNLRIADFAPLKGVASGALYPGIWYRENWDTLARDFNYEERHSDKLVKRMCGRREVALNTLTEVRARFAGMPYFFDHALIDHIIQLAN